MDNYSILQSRKFTGMHPIPPTTNNVDATELKYYLFNYLLIKI